MTKFIQLLPFLIILPPIAYALLCLYSANRYFGRKKLQASYFPPFSILKPVKGIDAESYENFASFCRQDYPSFQIIFAVAAKDDPVVPVINRLIEEFPGIDIQLVIDSRTYGPNYKVCNLMNAYPFAKHDLIIVCDSDISVGVNYLRDVCAYFAEPEVGLVSSLYRSSSVCGTAAAVEALGFTTEMIPNVMTAMALEGLSFALGASMAVRREALERIGGFAALVDYLADDYQLGNMVHKAGYRIELSEYFVESVIRRERLSTVLSRQLRWCRTMRVSRPAGYFMSGITQPFPLAVLALIAVVLTSNVISGVIAAALLYIVRFLAALIFSRYYVKDNLLPCYFWLLPLRDMFAFATWGLAFTGNKVSWRGHRYIVRSGGRMEEVS